MISCHQLFIFFGSVVFTVGCVSSLRPVHSEGADVKNHPCLSEVTIPKIDIDSSYVCDAFNAVWLAVEDVDSSVKMKYTMLIDTHHMEIKRQDIVYKRAGVAFPEIMNDLCRLYGVKWRIDEDRADPDDPFVILIYK